MAESAPMIYGFNGGDTNALLRLIGRTGNLLPGVSTTSDNAIGICLTTSSVSAISGSTAGTGTANVYYIDDSNVLNVAESISVWNIGSTSIASGKWCLYFRTGNKLVAVEVC